MTVDGENDVVLNGIAAALKPGGHAGAVGIQQLLRGQVPRGGDLRRGEWSQSRTARKSVTSRGLSAEVDLWTACYTPRELRLLCDRAGLDVVDIFSVEPGRYTRMNPSTESAEFLVIARRR